MTTVYHLRVKHAKTKSNNSNCMFRLVWCSFSCQPRKRVKSLYCSGSCTLACLRSIFIVVQVLHKAGSPFPSPSPVSSHSAGKLSANLPGRATTETSSAALTGSRRQLWCCVFQRLNSDRAVFKLGSLRVKLCRALWSLHKPSEDHDMTTAVEKISLGVSLFLSDYHPTVWS